jgi:uncharacterized RmlC-like cupin family protein
MVRAGKKASSVTTSSARAASAKAAPAKSAIRRNEAAKTAPTRVVSGKAAAARTAAPKAASAKAPARTPASPAAPVAKVAARRPAVRPTVPTPAARRSRAIAAPRKLAARKLSAKGPQVFTVSHLNQDDFRQDGLRPYAKYRDLGIAAATSGLCQAHVIRFIPPCTDEVRKRHLHRTELQLVYVLQGWIKNEFEGHGEQMMSVGSCWLQPSGIRHTVLDYSPDCELLEIIVPADFTTEDVG